MTLMIIVGELINASRKAVTAAIKIKIQKRYSN